MPHVILVLELHYITNNHLKWKSSYLPQQKEISKAYDPQLPHAIERATEAYGEDNWATGKLQYRGLVFRLKQKHKNINIYNAERSLFFDGPSLSTL